MNVLVLEDTQKNLDQITSMLEKAEANFVVYPYRTYNEAWDQFKEFRKNKEKLDLLIVDIRLDIDNMPEGGLEFASEVRKIQSIPTIILSEYFNEAEYAQKIKDLDLPIRYFFPKASLHIEGMLLEQIWSAIFEHQRREWTVGEYLQQTTRKIGMLDNQGIYQFFGKEDIIYLTSDDKFTVIYMTDKRKVLITSNVGHIGPLLQYNYPNICRFGTSHWVNLEKIVSFDMRNKDDLQRNPELTLEGDHKLKMSRSDFRLLFSEGLLIQPKIRK